MARSDHDESPRSSRRSKKVPHNVPPAAPEVPDFYHTAPGDELESPRRRRRSERGWDTDRSRHREADWDPRHDDEVLLRTPESRASSSSYHPSHRRRYHESGSRRDRSTTPSHSAASSMTSVLTPHPPRSSVTRPSPGNVVYRRPSVSIREAALADYDENLSRGSRRSHSLARSIPAVPSAPLSRRTSRTLRSASVSSAQTDSQASEELVYDLGHDDIREQRIYRETRLVRAEREERSRSRAGTRVSYQSARRQDLLMSDGEGYEGADLRPHPSLDEVRPRAMRSRPPSRSPSRPASVRQILDPESDHEHDADSDEPPARDSRESFDRRRSRKSRQSSRTPREHARSRSENPAKRSPPTKRSSKLYYESEAPAASRLDYRRAPSTSVRRSNTVSGSGSVSASRHQSVSSSTRRSSSFLGSFFGSSLPGHSHHHAPAKPVKLYECVVCMDERPARKMPKLKCGHRMCYSCLKRSFKLSITDPQHMPPKCCTSDHIPLKHVERLFDISFKKNWNKKLAEFTARDRVYCPKPSCGEFIRSEDIRHTNDRRKYGKCSKCSTKVCLHCSCRLHRERDCPKDEETSRILAQAKEEGWQRCYKCRAMIELQEGCNHMTCRCGAEFCYVCGEKWKSCSCPWFNYETVENDRLQHMQIPTPTRERFGGRPVMDMPPSPQRESRYASRSRPQTYEEELLFRRLQEEQDEALARRMQNYRDPEDARDDDFLDGFGEINGLGNAAGHFMNDNFRPRPRNIVVPQPPPAPHPPMIPVEHTPIFDRPQAGDYVQGVRRARGVRANSLTRLADRFNSDLRTGPTHRMPPTLQPSATMPLPTMQSALAPGPQIRRNTGPDGGGGEVGMRSVERPSGRITRPVVYDEPEEVASVRDSAERRQHHVKEPARAPKQSAMAGLTGDERYGGRVEEWMTYVHAGEPTAEVGYSG